MLRLKKEEEVVGMDMLAYAKNKGLISNSYLKLSLKCILYQNAKAAEEII